MFSLLWIAGCSNKSNPAGASLLPVSDIVQPKTAILPAIASTTVYSYTNTSFSANLIIGKSTEQESWGLIAFSGVVDSLRNATVLSAQIELRMRYQKGSQTSDTSSQAIYNVSMHKVLKAVRLDTVQFATMSSADFYDPTVIGTATTSIFNDSALFEIPFSDLTVVNSWFSSGGDTSNLGVLLKPGAGNTLLKGFHSFNTSLTNYAPRLRVVLQRVNATQTDTILLQTGVDTFTGQYTGASPLNDSVRILIMNGVSYKGELGFFLPDSLKKVTVHKALLRLHSVDNGLELGTNSTKFLVSNVLDSEGAEFSAAYAQGSEVTSGRYRFEFQINEYLRRWMLTSVVPRVRITGYDAATGAERFILHGAASAIDSLRPHIHITYSISK